MTAEACARSAATRPTPPSPRDDDQTPIGSIFRGKESVFKRDQSNKSCASSKLIAQSVRRDTTLEGGVVCGMRMIARKLTVVAATGLSTSIGIHVVG